MREKTSGTKKYIAGLVFTALASTGIGAVVGAYNPDTVKNLPKNVNEKMTDLEYKALPYMPKFLKDIYNFFGNLHHEKYDTLEERYEANRQKQGD